MIYSALRRQVGCSQNFKQTVDITSVIVKMGRYSYGISPDAHKNLRVPE